MIEGKIQVPKSLLSHLAESERVSNTLESVISKVNSLDKSQSFFDKFINSPFEKWVIADNCSSSFTFLRGNIQDTFELPSEILVNWAFIHNPSFQEKLIDLKEQYNRTKSIKIYSKIKQIQGELKSALLRELRKKLKIFKGESKLIINTISSGCRTINLRLGFRQIFHFLFKTLSDEEHLEIFIRGMKTPIFIFKYFNYEKLFFKGLSR